MQKEFKRAVRRAGFDTTKHMSAALRKETRLSNWPRNVRTSLRVNYNRNGFNVAVHPTHAETAFNYEYGTPEMRPTAAIRRVLNRIQNSESFFLTKTAQHLGVE